MLVRLALRSATMAVTPLAHLARPGTAPIAAVQVRSAARIAVAPPPASASFARPIGLNPVRAIICAATASDVELLSTSSADPLSIRRELKPFSKKTKIRELKVRRPSPSLPSACPGALTEILLRFRVAHSVFWCLRLARKLRHL
jgi:hypothetical protein